MLGTKRAISAVAVMAAAFGIAATAGAGPVVRSTVTLRTNGKAVAQGRVESANVSCVVDRKVLLISITSGGAFDFDRTNAKGKWDFSSQLDGATLVQAKVKRKAIGPNKFCGADTSGIKNAFLG